MVQDNLTECFNKMNCDGIYYRELLLLFYLFLKIFNSFVFHLSRSSFLVGNWEFHEVSLDETVDFAVHHGIYV